MPSLVASKRSSLPNDVVGKLDDLDHEFSEGDLTEKGYCKRKWKLLEPYAESSLCDQVSTLLKNLESASLSEGEYFKEMRQLLDLDTKIKLEQINENEENSSGTESKTDDVTEPELESVVEEPKNKIPNKKSSQIKKQNSISNMFNNYNKAKKNGQSSSDKNTDALVTTNDEEVLHEDDADDVEELPEKKRKLDDEVKLEIEDTVSKPDSNGSTSQNNGSEIIKSDCVSMPPEKKAKLENDVSQKRSFKSPNVKDHKPGVPEKCKICHQLLDDTDTVMYSGHPTGAVEEYVALTDPRLMLFNGTENDIDEHDERPQNKITYFSVYDKEGHLCPFDSGLVERNVLLYFSGYVKAIYEESADIEGGIPAFDIGPINEWWISGFDGGEKALIGFSTPYGEYYLMQPSKAYEPFMEAVTEKIYMGKLVIEFLLDESNATYEDLLNKLQTTVPPKGLSALSEDSLLRHAQFICDQVQSFDAAADIPDDQLITTPCMRALVKLAGVTFGKRRAMRRTEKKELKEKKSQWSKATATPLVTNVFETFFTEQLDKRVDNKDDLHGPRRRRCGVCEACQQPDCGTCAACLDMVKFGGSGRAKQACSRRRCPNMAIQEADDSDNEEENDQYQTQTVPGLIDESSSQSWTSRPRGICTRREKKDISWIGDPVKEDVRKTYYSKVSIGDDELSQGVYVLVEPSDPGVPMFIGRVIYMWQENLSKEKYFHAQWLCRGSDTVLGETADENEIFSLYECEDLPMTAVKSTVNVKYIAPPSDWALEGGKPVAEISTSENNDDGKTFFYQKRYDPEHGRFEDIEDDLPCRRKEMEHRFCSACERIYLSQKHETPTVDEKLDTAGENKEVYYGVVNWRGEEYRVGTFVFLAPEIFKFKRQLALTNGSFSLKKETGKNEKVDEDMYPEYYRKTSDHVKGSNCSTPPPFCIGYISAILTRSQDKLVAAKDICVKVNKMYRPENTHKGPSLTQQADLNMLYWSDEQKVVNFGDVAGKCYVVFSENIDSSIEEWTAEGPNRFYFTQAYDSNKQVFIDPPSLASRIGSVGKGKGKGKGKSKSKSEEKKEDRAKPWPAVSKPLRCLDVFAGCGGLSLGLHQSGAAESCWAVEKEEAAAHAFRLNNPNATVFTEDCNLLLRMVMDGETKNSKGQLLPQRGEVELLCGGPPCQGFSGMNRFNSRQYSLFKNSLVVSYLAYCDYYRPRFFILENVRNFVSFKRSMVLKLALRCLVRMGYQCTFGVLQAGNYGVPQTRRRAIIIAAAPGESLPLFPEPTHTFNPRTTQLTVMVDDKKFVSNCRWIDCAPRRTITVRDAMSDLPEIRNGARCDEMPYNGDPVSHFQRLIRGNQYQPMLTDHICKEMAPLVEARIAQIPTRTGSDWRDLPNIVVRLSDGTFTKKLQYTHHDKKNGKSSTGALRGVCTCATGKACDPMDRQFNTLIPWCLPHTGNRHNHWAGLYGRLEWDGFFSTTVTNPEPMGKQGRVLHPEQTRVVSVRECARSQGFPDTYRFFGSILDKHRQIGNAVPPPMGEALGFEIRKCISNYETKQKMEVTPS